jgi:hypothetical protein
LNRRVTRPYAMRKLKKHDASFWLDGQQGDAENARLSVFSQIDK